MPKYYQITFNLIAGLLIVLLVGDILYRRAGQDSREVAVQAPEAPVVAAAVPEQVPVERDYQVVSARNIFAVSKLLAAQNPVIEDPAALAPTSLRVRLLGTVAGDSRNGRAIILDEEKSKQNIYKVGDSLQGGEIKRILREKVVIQVDGRDEMLVMSEKSDSELTRSASVRLASSLPAPSMPTQDRPNPLGPNLSSLPPGSSPDLSGLPSGGSPDMIDLSPGSSSLTISRSELQKLSPNTEQITKQAGFVPYLKKGVTEGLIINQIKANSIFEKLKISNGDIVQKINGKSIQSPEDLEVIAQSLESESQINIELTRRGRLRNINYNLR